MNRTTPTLAIQLLKSHAENINAPPKSRWLSRGRFLSINHGGVLLPLYARVVNGNRVPSPRPDADDPSPTGLTGGMDLQVLGEGPTMP